MNKNRNKKGAMYVKVKNGEALTSFYFQFTDDINSRYEEWWAQVCLTEKELQLVANQTKNPTHIDDGIRQYLVSPERIKIIESESVVVIESASKRGTKNLNTVISCNTIRLFRAAMVLRKKSKDAIINLDSLDREIPSEKIVHPYIGSVSVWLSQYPNELCHQKPQLIKTVANFCKKLSRDKRESFLGRLKRFHGFLLCGSRSLDEIGFLGNSNVWFNGNGAIILRDNDFSIHT